MCVIINVLNCWKDLKTIELQRENEICLSVNAAKAEKIKRMAYGQILSAE